MNVETPTELRIKRRHLLGVLLANSLLWATAVLLTGGQGLGGVAAAALVSIASLLLTPTA